MLKVGAMATVVALAGCAGDASDVAGASIALRDPAGLLAGLNSLTAHVLPAGRTTCTAAAGLLAPSPPDVAAIPGAVATIDLDLAAPVPGDRVTVNAGRYAILLRGRGPDPISMRADAITCTGCAMATVGGGQTVTVSIELHAAIVTGMCGDGTLSPDEQCEDGGTMAGDGCSDTCRSEPLLVSRRVGMTPAAETVPAVGWREGTRAIMAYDSDGTGGRDIRLMLLSEEGAIIATPTAFAVDTAVESFSAIQTTPSASVGGTSMTVAYADFSAASMRGDVRMAFYDMNRAHLPGSPMLATATSTGVQMSPAVATMADDTAMVVFADDASTTGLSGRIFARGAPAGAAFEVGAGAASGAEPSIAAHGMGFMVAFAAGGDVFFQRFAGDGSPLDALAQPLTQGADSTGTQDQPAVAALDDGRAMVAWRDDSHGDMNGTAIVGRAISAAGAPQGMPFTVNTTGVGAQSAPTAAAGRERFAIAWQDPGGIRARMFGGDGAPALNRNTPPTTEDFQIATGVATAPSAATGGLSSAPQWTVVWQDGNTDPLGDIQARSFALP